MELHPYGRAFAARDLDRLMSMLTDDVVLHSPFVSEPGFEGRDSVAVILGIVVDVFKDNRYTHDVGDARSHVLVADSRVLDQPIKITTLLEFDARGKICEIWMMARPLTGVMAIAQAVGQAIENQDPSVHELAKPLADLAAVIDRTAAGLVDDLNSSMTERSSAL